MIGIIRLSQVISLCFRILNYGVETSMMSSEPTFDFFFNMFLLCVSCILTGTDKNCTEYQKYLIVCGAGPDSSRLHVWKLSLSACDAASSVGVTVVSAPLC